MTIHSPAIVLHSLKYGDSDLIVTLFTETSGLRTYLLRGILKSKRAKIKASLFQPLTLIEIEAFHKNKGTLERIKEAKLLIPYQSLHTHILKNALVFFLAEVLKSSIREEEANYELFSFLKTTLLWLDAHDTIANFHIAFLIKLTQYLGFYPDVSTITYPYFNLQEGSFQQEASSIYCSNETHIDTFKLFLGTTFDDAMYIPLTKTTRSDLLQLLLVYFELHLQGFKKPKSLAILNEIFT